MKFDIVTIFPEFFAGPLHYGVMRRARECGLIDIRVHDLRQFTHDRHKTVDDRPFGGGEGMVLKPEPIFKAVETILSEDTSRKPGADAAQAQAQHTAIVLLSASGKIFVQETAQRFASLDHIVLLCGRYEGVDERVAEHLATDEISIGDFVLSGGELAAALVIDAVTRLLPGALGNEASSVNESFSPRQNPPPAGERKEVQLRREIPLTEDGSSLHVLLDCPHYTRPADFRGWRVPEVLISGNHEEIRRWRERVALEKTRRNRPDLLSRTIP
jgi:tRNA (guanine37-N1)-methyltransferase